MKLYLRTLSPVHIGTGEELFSLDYVVVGDIYYRVSQDHFLNFLLQEAPKKLETYAKWIVDTADKLEDLRENKYRRMEELGRWDYNQRLSSIQQDFNLLSFCKQERLDAQFKAYLQQNSKDFNDPQSIKAYKVKGELAQKKLQVRGLISNPSDNRPYLPGSSIKGAIRTALLYRALMKHGKAFEDKLIRAIEKDLRKDENPRRLAGKIGAQMEYQMAYGGIKKNKEDNFVNFQDVQQDIFKFLQISDAHLHQASNTAVEVSKSNLFLVTNVSRNSREKIFKATYQPQSPTIEAICVGNIFTFELHFKLRELWGIYQAIQQQQERLTWIDLESKLEQIFNLDITTVTKENIESKKQEVENYVLSSLTEFAEAQIDFEKNWLEQQFFKHELDTQRIRFPKENFEDAFSRPFAYPFGDTTLLRLGYGTGFSNSTELIYLLSQPRLKELFIDIMEKFGIGMRPGMKGKYKASTEKFPKSRTLLTYKNSIQPLGWTELSANNQWPDIERAVQEQKQNIEVSSPKVEPTFFKGKLRQGEVVDALYIKDQGKKKVFELFLKEGKKQEVAINFFADLDKDKVYRIQINGISKDGTIMSGSFKGTKKI